MYLRLLHYCSIMSEAPRQEHTRIFIHISYLASFLGSPLCTHNYCMTSDPQVWIRDHVITTHCRGELEKEAIAYL